MMDSLAALDASIFRSLNDYCGWSPTLDRIVVHMEVLKGSIFMGIVGVLWFQPDTDQPRRRQTIIIIILSTALALVFNRALSTLLPFRSRPMYSIGASSRSPSPITIRPFIGTVSMTSRIASTATWSECLRSP